MASIAIDLDGTLRSWESGLPLNGSAMAVRILASNARLILHTCRTQMPGGDEEIERFLSQSAFSKVEFEVWRGVGKPVASAYIDDRAVSLRGEADWPRAAREALWLLENRPEVASPEKRP